MTSIPCNREDESPRFSPRYTLDSDDECVHILPSSEPEINNRWDWEEGKPAPSPIYGQGGQEASLPTMNPDLESGAPRNEASRPLTKIDRKAAAKAAQCTLRRRQATEEKHVSRHIVNQLHPLKLPKEMPAKVKAVLMKTRKKRATETLNELEEDPDNHAFLAKVYSDLIKKIESGERPHISSSKAPIYISAITRRLDRLRPSFTQNDSPIIFPHLPFH